MLNDELRTTGKGGTLLITRGLEGRGEAFVAQALERVRSFSAFTPENDPYGEHDFGAFTLQGVRLLFKIDYYDKGLTRGSPDPANPEVTHRVLTVLLAEECRCQAKKSQKCRLKMSHFVVAELSRLGDLRLGVSAGVRGVWVAVVA